MFSTLARRLDRGLGLLEATLLVVALVASVASLIADVALRNAINVALPWAAELTRYAIVWMVFIGAGVAARAGGHISIDVIAEVLPPRIGRAVAVGAMALSALASAVFAVISAQLVMQMMAFRQLSPSLEIPMWWVYLALPVGFGLMTIRFTQAAVAATSPDASPAHHQAAG